nr:reverse transcriptase domain-containing protein [Tanacetum cinerariifolium]
MERFKEETGRMKGAPECMRISGFMHSINNPELTKRLNEHIPRTMEEMMIATTAFIRGEAAAANKKKSHMSWRPQDQSKKHTDKRPDFPRRHPCPHPAEPSQQPSPQPSPQPTEASPHSGRAESTAESIAVSTAESTAGHYHLRTHHHHYSPHNPPPPLLTTEPTTTTTTRPPDPLVTESTSGRAESAVESTAEPIAESTADRSGCMGCFANRGKGKRKPNLGDKAVGRLNTRDKTRNLSLKEITDTKGPVSIQFELHDKQTVMPLGDHAAHWSSYIGEGISGVPLYYPSWLKVPKERKVALITDIGVS